MKVGENWAGLLPGSHAMRISENAMHVCLVATCTGNVREWLASGGCNGGTLVVWSGPQVAYEIDLSD